MEHRTGSRSAAGRLRDSVYRLEMGLLDRFSSNMSGDAQHRLVHQRDESQSLASEKDCTSTLRARTC
nr:hypothetical protein CFP56_50330 [Quercus suber]